MARPTSHARPIEPREAEAEAGAVGRALARRSSADARRALHDPRGGADRVAEHRQPGEGDERQRCHDEHDVEVAEEGQGLWRGACEGSVGHQHGDRRATLQPS